MHFHSPLDSLHMQENSKDRISIAWCKNDPRIDGWWLPQWSSRLPHVSNIYSMYLSMCLDQLLQERLAKDWQSHGESHREISRRARSHVGSLVELQGDAPEEQNSARLFLTMLLYVTMWRRKQHVV